MTRALWGFDVYRLRCRPPKTRTSSSTQYDVHETRPKNLDAVGLPNQANVVDVTQGVEWPIRIAGEECT